MPYTGRVWVAETDQIIAVWGWCRMGLNKVVFMDFSEEATKYPVTMFKTAKQFMKQVPQGVICIADPDLDTAPAFLDRLGWVHDAHHEDGDLYVRY